MRRFEPRLPGCSSERRPAQVRATRSSPATPAPPPARIRWPTSATAFSGRHTDGRQPDRQQILGRDRVSRHRSAGRHRGEPARPAAGFARRLRRPHRRDGAVARFTRPRRRDPHRRESHRGPASIPTLRGWANDLGAVELESSGCAELLLANDTIQGPAARLACVIRVGPSFSVAGPSGSLDLHALTEVIFENWAAVLIDGEMSVETAPLASLP